jgi:hypothetical protein
MYPASKYLMIETRTDSGSQFMCILRIHILGSMIGYTYAYICDERTKTGKVHEVKFGQRAFIEETSMDGAINNAHVKWCCLGVSACASFTSRSLNLPSTLNALLSSYSCVQEKQRVKEQACESAKLLSNDRRNSSTTSAGGEHSTSAADRRSPTTSTTARRRTRTDTGSSEESEKGLGIPKETAPKHRRHTEGKAREGSGRGQTKILIQSRARKDSAGKAPERGGRGAEAERSFQRQRKRRIAQQSHALERQPRCIILNTDRAPGYASRSTNRALIPTAAEWRYGATAGA